MNLDLSGAVYYHTGRFPPVDLDYARLLPDLLAATKALARYDQMLRGRHNRKTRVWETRVRLLFVRY